MSVTLHENQGGWWCAGLSCGEPKNVVALQLVCFSIQSWLSHEVEVLSSISHAKRTLEELIDDRKTISHQLNELREQDVGQPPAKVGDTSLSCACII